MANIKASICNAIRDALAAHHVLTITGTYDGAIGNLVLNWSDDSLNSDFKFPYAGKDQQNFAEFLLNLAGSLVAQYNTRFTQSEFDAFMAQVTE